MLWRPIRTLTKLIDAIVYGYLYAYSIDLANNAEGGTLEDEINKLYRPIALNITTVSITKFRYAVITSVWLLYSYFLQL
jgi:preprotein translocase subunit Sec63